MIAFKQNSDIFDIFIIVFNIIYPKELPRTFNLCGKKYLDVNFIVRSNWPHFSKQIQYPIAHSRTRFLVAHLSAAATA